MLDESLLPLIPLFPLAGAFISGLYSLSKHNSEEGPNKKLIATISCLAPIAAFILSALFFLDLSGKEETARFFSYSLFDWINSGRLNVNAEFYLDPLSSMMTLVITFIGSLIHLYSVGYMEKDRGFGRYFSYLNLFTFSMLMLVLGKNFPMMFLGWEGVGLCSYLLIGFWFNDKEKAIAGNKAFIANRVGDFGLLMGMFLIFWALQGKTTNALDFFAIKDHIKLIDPTLATAITMLLFVGCMGKSAQIPLHVWLPDAMAGPTPVSALIHAATMVTAGIYLIVRLNFLYSMAPNTLAFILLIGVLTAFFAATVAITQSDIKKVLAYSTVSQLGFMFIAVGSGAYVAATFHLFTHAFFKALLFLGSGSVIHAMSEEQNIWKMGGLFSKMKVTAITFGIGTLAIAGIPPLAGFFSKDEILWKLWETGNTVAYGLTLLTAGLTAFYMSRLFFLTFSGDKVRHEDHHVVEHIHESPMLMTLPLIILAIGSCLVGFLGIPHNSMFESWLEPVISTTHKVAEVHTEDSMEYILMALSVVVAVIGISFAYVLYVKDKSGNLVKKLTGKTLFNISNNKWFFDEVNQKILVTPIIKVSDYFLFRFVEKILIDGLVNGTAKFYSAMSYGFRDISTGKSRNYAYFMIIGLIIMFSYAILK
ncbi:MAG: NADH-quinone oxidoreductase subunit L [Candidatus Sericytochromatia bacterium]